MSANFTISADRTSKDTVFLVKDLVRRLRSFLSVERLIIVGFGNRWCGDDAFGVAVIQLLHGRIACPLIDAGACPENFLGRIVDFKPDSVLFLDAGYWGGVPGELRLCGQDALASGGLSSHASSVSLIAQYLATATGCQCQFLCAQSSNIERALNRGEGEGAWKSIESFTMATVDLSLPVRKAAHIASDMIASLYAPSSVSSEAGIT